MALFLLIIIIFFIKNYWIVHSLRFLDINSETQVKLSKCHHSHLHHLLSSLSFFLPLFFSQSLSTPNFPGPLLCSVYVYFLLTRMFLALGMASSYSWKNACCLKEIHILFIMFKEKKPYIPIQVPNFIEEPVWVRYLPYIPIAGNKQTVQDNVHERRSMQEPLGNQMVWSGISVNEMGQS